MARPQIRHGLSAEDKDIVIMDLQGAQAHIRGAKMMVHDRTGRNTAMYRRLDSISRHLQEVEDIVNNYKEVTSSWAQYEQTQFDFDNR